MNSLSFCLLATEEAVTSGAVTPSTNWTTWNYILYYAIYFAIIIVGIVVLAFLKRKTKNFSVKSMNNIHNEAITVLESTSESIKIKSKKSLHKKISTVQILLNKNINYSQVAIEINCDSLFESIRNKSLDALQFLQEAKQFGFDWANIEKSLQKSKNILYSIRADFEALSSRNIKLGK